LLELDILHALALSALSQDVEAHRLLGDSVTNHESKAPFDVKLSAQLARVQIRQRMGAAFDELEAVLAPALETARKKKMRWHLVWGLGLRGEALLAANRAEEAEVLLKEAVDVSTANADRTMFWQSAYRLGRAYEQMLRYERAVACYRMAALTIHEIGMDIEEERYKESFLASRACGRSSNGTND